MTAGGWVAVAFLAEFAAAAVVFRSLRRRAGGLPAPGDGHNPVRAPHSPAPGNNPVPGTTPQQVTPRPPARPSPAPGHTHPEHGIRLLSADFYEDGTVLVHDHLRQRTTKFEAPEPGPGLDWDGWLEGMTP